MPVPNYLCHLLGIDPRALTKEENFLLEAKLFIYFFEQIKNEFRKQYKEYFQLIKLNIKKEEEMLNEKFIWYVMNDILSTQEYNLSGIAYYTETPEEVVNDIYIKGNIIPSFTFYRKIMELHKLAKPQLYKALAEKITMLFSDLLLKDSKIKTE